MWIHFFLLPPCAVVPTTAAFVGKKGVFFLASPWFHHFLKITWNRPHTGKWAWHQGRRRFLACPHNLLQSPLRLVVSLVRLCLGRGLEWACKVMYSCLPRSKWQSTDCNAGHGQGLFSGSLSYLRAVLVLFLVQGGVAKIYCPTNGVFGSWTVFLEAAHWPKRGLLRFATQGHLNRRDANYEGLIADQRSTIHHDPSNDGVEFL